jgi:hypothetical protein
MYPVKKQRLFFRSKVSMRASKNIVSEASKFGRAVLDRAARRLTDMLHGMISHVLGYSPLPVRVETRDAVARRRARTMSRRAR